jgi:hypothetical protein
MYMEYIDTLHMSVPTLLVQIAEPLGNTRKQKFERNLIPGQPSHGGCRVLIEALREVAVGCCRYR